MKRREFIKLSGGAILSAPMIFSKNLAFAQEISTISIAKHAGASSVTGDPSLGTIPNMAVQRWAVNSIVDQMILRFTNKVTVGEAWESLFPAGALSTDTKIAIKVNHSYDIYTNYSANMPDRMCPWGQKAVVAEAIIDGLKQMLGGTFPVENITVFDKLVDQIGSNGHAYSAALGMARQGYLPSLNPQTTPYNTSGPGLYNAMLVNYWDSTIIAGMPTFTAGSQQVRQVVFPPIENSDFWINIGIPKDHSTAGYTAMMKNCFGCTNNCQGSHSTIHDSLPDFYTKLTAITPCILNVLDALAGIWDGGPSYGTPFYPNIIACSTDPLALEYYGLELLNQARTADDNYSAIGITAGKNADRHANAYFLTLAQDTTKYNLGNFNAGNRISTDLSAGIKTPRPLRSLDSPHGRIDLLSRSGAGWRLYVTLDASGRTHIVESSIFDVSGRTVKKLRGEKTLLSAAQLFWDGRNERGSSVAPGVYTWQVRINGRASHQSVFVP